MITQQSAKNNQLIKNNKKINILLSAISLDVDKTILTHPLKYSPGFQTGSKVKTSNFPKSEWKLSGWFRDWWTGRRGSLRSGKLRICTDAKSSKTHQLFCCSLALSMHDETFIYVLKTALFLPCCFLMCEIPSIIFLSMLKASTFALPLILHPKLLYSYSNNTGHTK